MSRATWSERKQAISGPLAETEMKVLDLRNLIFSSGCYISVEDRSQPRKIPEEELLKEISGLGRTPLRLREDPLGLKQGLAKHLFGRSVRLLFGCYVTKLLSTSWSTDQDRASRWESRRTAVTFPAERPLAVGDGNYGVFQT